MAFTLAPIRWDKIKFATETRERLPRPLFVQLEKIYRRIGHYLDETLDDFVSSFALDAEPARETLVWRKISDAFQLYTKRYGIAELTIPELQTIVLELIALACG